MTKKTESHFAFPTEILVGDTHLKNRRNLFFFDIFYTKTMKGLKVPTEVYISCFLSILFAWSVTWKVPKRPSSSSKASVMYSPSRASRRPGERMHGSCLDFFLAVAPACRSQCSQVVLASISPSLFFLLLNCAYNIEKSYNCEWQVPYNPCLVLTS